jgi:hypothetical protein
MKKIPITHFAFLLPVQFVILSVLIIYIGEPDARIFISPIEIFIPALLLALAAFLLFLILLIFTRTSLSAALYACIIVLGILFQWQIFLVVIFSTLFSLILMRWVIKKSGLAAIAIAFQTIAIAFGFFYGIQYINLFRKTTDALSSKPASISRSVPSSDQLPDIYYIILDGYGRGDMLKSVHGYDNSFFLSELQKRGFVIPVYSQANYPRTLLSLSSSLNMKYLDSEVNELGSANYWWLLGPLLKHNAVRTVLEQAGYKTVFFASGWDFTDIRDGDSYMSPYPIMLNDFERAYIEITNLRYLVTGSSDLVSLPSFDTHRRIILYQFQTLPKIASLPGPKFVFAHIVNPHPPFVFDKGGAPINPAYPYSLSYAQGLFGDVSEYRASYLAQLTYDNQLVLKMIDGILSNSPTPPIIIVQGDHGPGIFSDFDNLENTCLYERYSILNAYYLPGSYESDAIPQDISPVNTFRLIFSEYLGLDYPPLPEKRYFSDNNSFYQFQDVTSMTEIPCETLGGK